MAGRRKENGAAEERRMRLSRRIRRLEEQCDFLMEGIINHPYRGMAEHRRLIGEWEEEIAFLESELRKMDSGINHK